MKRMIINPAQLKAINEAAAAFTYDGSVNNDFQTQLSNFKMKNTSALDGVIQGINTSDAATKPATTNTGDSQTAKGVIITPDSNTGSSLSSALEETRYSKRQVELGRMLEMRKNGKVFSKKQLNEMFMETQDNAKRLRAGIGNCRIFDIFKAIEEVFPEEIENVKEAFSNGADLPEVICSIFSKDDINGEREEKFLERLGI